MFQEVRACVFTRLGRCEVVKKYIVSIFSHKGHTDRFAFDNTYQDFSALMTSSILSIPVARDLIAKQFNLDMFLKGFEFL
jgi:hypothetical protein